jgi:hypothetical protein
MTALTINSRSRPKAVWRSAKKSYSERIFGAIDYLEFKVRNANAAEACRSIERVIAEQRKYQLFQKFFSDEWNRSRTSLFKAGCFVNYSERANEFIELVNEHLFPVLGGWYEEPEADFENFNIYSLNVDFCCDEIEYEYLQVSYVAALLFLSQANDVWEYFEQNYKLRRKDFPEINHYSFDKIWNLEKTGRVGLYLNIFEVVDHSTGNPWIDNTNCQYYENYSWDEKTVQFLTDSYRGAREMLQKTELLDELIEAHPKEILGEMISLWNTGKIPEPKTSGRQPAKKRLPKANE